MPIYQGEFEDDNMQIFVQVDSKDMISAIDLIRGIMTEHKFEKTIFKGLKILRINWEEVNQTKIIKKKNIEGEKNG